MGLSALVGNYRHFVNLLDSEMYPMSPAETMSKTTLRWSLTTIHGQQEVRNCPSCRISSSLVWSGVAFDHWPTHKKNPVLRRVFPVTGRQACHRVIALSPRDQDGEHFPVHPRSFAPSPSAVITVVEFLNTRR